MPGNTTAIREVVEHYGAVAIVAIAIALFVPVIGSIGAVALYIYAARRAPDPAGDAPSLDMG